MADDHYQALEVPHDATADAIKDAWRRIAKASHPDRNPDDEAAVARFLRASEAYEVLGDPARRARYDQSLRVPKRAPRPWDDDIVWAPQGLQRRSELPIRHGLLHPRRRQVRNFGLQSCLHQRRSPALRDRLLHDDGRRAREVAMQTVMRHLLKRLDFESGLILSVRSRHAFDDHIAAELARDHDQRPIEQAARFQIENQLRDWAIDLFVKSVDGGVPVLVRVPMDKRDVLGRDFNEPGSVFDEPPREQTSLAESPGVVLLVTLFRLQRNVERRPFLRAQ